MRSISLRSNTKETILHSKGKPAHQEEIQEPKQSPLKWWEKQEKPKKEKFADWKSNESNRDSSLKKSTKWEDMKSNKKIKEEKMNSRIKDNMRWQGSQKRKQDLNGNKKWKDKSNTNLLNSQRKKRGSEENMKCRDLQKNKKEIGKNKPSFRRRLLSKENVNRESWREDRKKRRRWERWRDLQRKRGYWRSQRLSWLRRGERLKHSNSNNWWSSNKNGTDS